MFPPHRHRALDAARLLAMLAMVFGHTADALLSEAARALPGVKLYWVFRGFTAPLFLAVSGWAFWVATKSHPGGRPLLQRFARRGLWLFACGYFLRLPLWDIPLWLRGDRELWRHFTGFDALHAVGASLLLAALLFSVTARPTVRWIASAAVLLGVVLLGTSVAHWLGWSEVPFPLRAAFLTDDQSVFPLFPWVAYFFAGLLVGAVGQRGLWLLLMGTVSVAGVTWAGIHDFSVTHPLLFVERMGAVLMVIGGLSLLPARAVAWTTPWSRSSLGVYVFHILVLFGFWRWTGLIVVVGRTLDLAGVAVVSVLLLVTGLATVSLWTQLKERRAATLQPGEAA